MKKDPYEILGVDKSASDKDIKNSHIDEVTLIKKAKKYLKKYSLKDVVELLSNEGKINKNKIYKLCLNIKKDEKSN